MDIVGYIILAIGALCTFLSGFICRKLSWDDSATSVRLIAIKFMGFIVAFVGVLMIFGMF